jgi:hypothetical protein
VNLDLTCHAGYESADVRSNIPDDYTPWKQIETSERASKLLIVQI